MNIFSEGVDAMEILDVESEAMIQRWPSGFNFLDEMCGGGLPRGIVEFFGAYSSCKSALSSHIIGTTLAAGGAAQLYDQEDAFEVKRFQSLTNLTLEDYIDRNAKRQITQDSKFIPARADSLEELLEDVETQAAHWRDNQIVENSAPIIFVLDSLASTESKAELERGYGKQEMASIPAALSRNLKKTVSAAHRFNFQLFIINQTREKIGVMFGDKTSTPGGLAIKFYAMMRVKMNLMKTRPDGLDIMLTTIKNKIFIPKRNIIMPFSYASGFSDFSTAIYLLKNYGWLKETGKSFKLRTSFKGDTWVDLPKGTDDPRIMSYAKQLYIHNHRMVKNDKE